MQNPAALEDHLGYWLRFVSNHVSQGFAERVAGAGVTVAEWVVLRRLYDHPDAAPSDLADGLGLTRGAISKLVERLAAKDLLTVTPNPRDRRGQRVTLTDAGRTLVPRLAALADANDAAFFACLTPEQRAQLQALLHQVIAANGLRALPLT